MAWTEYSARFLLPAYIERDRNTPLTLEVHAAGAISAPSSGTITIYDTSNTAVVSAAAVTIASSAATYTVPTATVASKSLGAGWRVEWSLVMADTYTHVFRQDSALVRVRLAPVVADADLILRHSDLTTFRPSSLSSYEPYIMEAWRDVVGRLEAMGRRPYLVISPEALRPVHMATTLALIFRDFGGTGDATNKWAALAEHYEKQAAQAWSSLSLVYDEADSGAGSASRRTGPSTLWLSSGGGSTYGRLW